MEAFPELIKLHQPGRPDAGVQRDPQQLRFAADDFSNRGIPILMRGFRSIMQEEMLNSALDSIADRLYTPLILTKLGATGAGSRQPPSRGSPTRMRWRSSMPHSTLRWRPTSAPSPITGRSTMQPVFGRENVPDLSNDFDRITERLLMVFGLSQTMLTGASAGETYAADALNRDVVTQLLSHYQRHAARLHRRAHAHRRRGAGALRLRGA